VLLWVPELFHAVGDSFFAVIALSEINTRYSGAGSRGKFFRAVEKLSATPRNRSKQKTNA
jgi:hypothetical protein